MVSYWVFRIDTDSSEFLYRELINNKILRQGWGWDERQDLRNLTMDNGAKRNMSIFKKVKKDDIILVPRLNNWNTVVIAKALYDWNSKEGYKFDIPKEQGDYGHCFSAEIIKEFSRNNSNVSSSIRSTLRTPSRFWNIDYLKDDVDKLLNTKLDLNDDIKVEDRIQYAVNNAIKASELDEKIKKEFIDNFQGIEWEYVLVEIFKKNFPNYIVERVGGKTEKNHGTDILIKIPSLERDLVYAIAIQVKDYINEVSVDVIDQINKADNYFNSDGIKLIDKYLLITRAFKEDNKELEDKKSDVKILYADDLEKLLIKYIFKEIDVE